MRPALVVCLLAGQICINFVALMTTDGHDQSLYLLHMRKGKYMYQPVLVRDQQQKVYKMYMMYRIV